MDFFVNDNLIEPEPGDLLISEPYLPDPNFERTVVLICEHDENGTIGFVLNRRSNSVLSDVIVEAAHFDAPLYVGGPVQHDTLHYVSKDMHEMESGESLGERLFWGKDFNQLLARINTHQIDKMDYRFFVGYSGWSPGQLMEELKTKSWIVYQNKDENLIFDFSSQDLWKKVLREMGGKYRLISNYPVDPRLN
jgi:putative transcriptional regulator|tara:strand:+ start:320 stop:898 length:579 start_codon:yes stop_codon:yes gene_type:complete